LITRPAWAKVDYQARTKPMTNSKASRILRAALFTLVPLAYLSKGLWRPADAYEKYGRAGFPAYAVVLMAAVFMVSALSWRTHRLAAGLGLLACFLWLCVVLLPVL